MSRAQPKILITGATGQVGRKTIDCLKSQEGIDRLFMMTGYTVDMLLQSKVLTDNAKKAGISHVVHLGACGPDDATVGHFA